MDDKHYLQLAIEQAKKSVDEDGFPAGAIIVKNGQVLAEGISVGFKNNDPTGHAETSAIRAACQKVKSSDLTGAVLYESLECCNMCFSVANWAGVSKIVFACKKTPEMVNKLYYEGTTSNYLLNQSNSHKIDLVFIPDFEQAALDLVKSWEEKNNGI